MFRLIESVKIKDGEIVNPSYHSHRMNQARRVLFTLATTLDIRDIISVPEACSIGIYKCRVTYADTIIECNFEKYSRRNIRSLKLVSDDTIEYSFKFENRGMLLSLLKQKEHHDDILIIKNGHITDTSFSNIAFFDGNSWITPSTCLLPGTKRAFLLDQGMVHAEELTVSDIPRFQHASLINAMLELGETILPVQNIV